MSDNIHGIPYCSLLKICGATYDKGKLIKIRVRCGKKRWDLIISKVEEVK